MGLGHDWEGRPRPPLPRRLALRLAQALHVTGNGGIAARIAVLPELTIKAQDIVTAGVPPVQEIGFVGSEGLRSLSKPFQSWKPNQTTMTTEVALEFVDGEASIMSFPLQPTKRHHAAGQMMPLSPLGTRLPTIQPALILAHTDDCLAWRPPPIETADLCGGQGQALRRVGPWRRI